MSTLLPALYSVLILPRREVVARGLTLRDASAWMQTYNDVLQGVPTQAVIAEEAASWQQTSRSVELTELLRKNSTRLARV